MTSCQICLKTYKKLKYQSKRIKICGRCVNSLNESPEFAENAQARISQMLKRGIERNALSDLYSEEAWKVRKAKWTIENLDSATEAALPNWINKLLANSENAGKDFKIVRAYRRGMIHLDSPSRKGYPKNWETIASRIRKLDHHKCVACGMSDTRLDVHHIVYLSNYGTHRKSNLITLCRDCHESEHKRLFDFSELVEAFTKHGENHEKSDQANDMSYISTANFAGDKTVIFCKNCGQKLRVPKARLLNIRCVSCAFVFKIST